MKEKKQKESQPNKRKKAKRRTGLGWGVVQFLIFLFCAAYMMIPILELTTGVDEIPWTFFLAVSCFVIYLAMAILMLAFAIVGHRKRSVGYTVVGCIGFVVGGLIGGVFGFVGGLLNASYYKKHPEEAAGIKKSVPEKAPREETLEEEAGSEASQDAAPEETTAANHVGTEYIKPKMGARGKKGIFIALAVIYGVTLLLGILFTAVPQISSVITGLGIAKEENARSLAIAMGMLWIAVTPTFGLYFATISPFKIEKKNRTLIAVITGALSVVLAVVAVVVMEVTDIRYHFEGDDSWFVPASAIFAPVALILCHLLTLFHLDPSKLKSINTETGDGFLNTIKHVLLVLVNAVIAFAKMILKFKEKNPDVFILVATVILTLFVYFTSFIVAIIVIAIMIVVVVLLFSNLVSFCYLPSNGDGVVISDGVYRYSLTETDRAGIYRDEQGREWKKEGDRYLLIE